MTNNEIKLDKKATNYLKDKIGSGGSGGGLSKLYNDLTTFNSTIQEMIDKAIAEDPSSFNTAVFIIRNTEENKNKLKAILSKYIDLNDYVKYGSYYSELQFKSRNAASVDHTLNMVNGIFDLFGFSYYTFDYLSDSYSFDDTIERLFSSDAEWFELNTNAFNLMPDFYYVEYQKLIVDDLDNRIPTQYTFQEYDVLDFLDLLDCYGSYVDPGR